MAYLDSHGLQTLFTKLKLTFAKNIGVSQGDSKVTVQLKDGATTPNILASADIEAATSTASGVMSKTDKSKLDGIEAEANKYVHPTTAGNKHVPAGGALGQLLGYDSDGTAKWVDAPETGVTKITPGDNVTISPSGGTGNVTVNAVDTTYESKSQVSGGSDVSLCTTGEKFTWNNKQDVIVFNTVYSAVDNKAATMSDIASAMSGAAKYKGTISTEAEFIALTNYKIGEYWVASQSFTHAVGVTTITVDAGNMIFCRVNYTTAYNYADFDIVQTDIEAIPDSVINALS